MAWSAGGILRREREEGEYTVNVISLLQASQWYRTPGSTRPGLAAFFLITPMASEAIEGVICAETGRAQSVLLRRVVYRI